MLSFGQEQKTNFIAVAWEQLSAPLTIHEEELATDTYTLLEVNLAIDLREQFFEKNNPPLMYIPQNKFVQPSYSINVSKPKTSTTGFSFSGRSTINSQHKTHGIRNTAYQEADSYINRFHPIRRSVY